VPQRFVQPAVLGPCPRQLQRAPHSDEQSFGRERLLQKLEGAELGGAHGIGERGLAAHHHDGDVGERPLQLLERRHAVRSPRHHEIQQDRVGRGLAHRGEGRSAVRRIGDLVPLFLEQRPDHAADVVLVVDQQHARAHAGNTRVKVAPPPSVSATAIVP
jgi:hypothetical protein